MVQHYADRDDRIQLIPRNHCGIVDTLNHGVQIARGEFIARLDADDIALPSRFASQLAFLNQHPDIALVGGRFQTIQANGTLWKNHAVPHGPQEVHSALQKSNCITHSAVMMRRSVLEQFAGPYRPWFPYAEDYDLWLRMSEHYRLDNVPDLVVQYRRDFANPRPARTVTQAVSALAALTVHTAAKTRGTELAIARPFDQESLLAIGCKEDRVAFAIYKALLAEARATAKAGFPTQAFNLVAESKKYAPHVWHLGRYADYAWKVVQIRLAA